MTDGTTTPVFDYRLQRFTMGLVAFLLPVVVTAVADQRLTSISASWYTSARDWFVGLLFAVATFLLAYRGHTRFQGWASKGAALAAALVALFPAACDGCETTWRNYVHYTAAAVLFLVLSLFCFVIFRKNTRGRPGKPGWRARIYLACGVLMLACLAGIPLGHLLLPVQTVAELRLTYWGEASALWAFGLAWIVSGKVLPFLAEPGERLHIWPSQSEG